MSQLKIQDPDKIKFTLTATMTLEDWILIRDSFKDESWPSSVLRNDIADMVSQAEKEFYPK